MCSQRAGVLLRKAFPTLSFKSRGVHVYKAKYSDSYNLAVDLAKGAIFCDKDIIVLNKPHGISFSNPNKEKKVSDKLPVANTDYEVSLSSLMPHLKEILKVDNLELVRAPEKYISGVAIFSSGNDNMGDHLKEQILRMRERATPSDGYLAVVVGIPHPSSSNYKGGITLKQQKNGKEKKVVMVKEWSQNNLRKGLVKRLTVLYDTLCWDQASNTSLVQFFATRNVWHCLRAFLACHLMTPLLGDQIFGSRVKTVLGAPVLLDPFSPAAQLPQKLSREVLTRLDLDSRADVAIPHHLHLSQVKVEGFPGRGDIWSVTMPPPQYFLWTCSRLALHPPQPEEITTCQVTAT